MSRCVACDRIFHPKRLENEDFEAICVKCRVADEISEEEFFIQDTLEEFGVFTVEK